MKAVGRCENFQEKFFPVEKHTPHNKDCVHSKPTSTKRRKTEKESTSRHIVKSCLDQEQTDNIFSRACNENNLEPMENVAQMMEEKRFDAIEITDLKHFIKSAVFKGKGEKLDFLVKGFEKYSKKSKIVHPSMILLQDGVGCSSTKRVTLMQQCLAEVSNREVCTHLLKWVSKRNLIKYLLEPTEEGQDMLIVEITAHNRVDILNLLFGKIDNFNLLEEEEESLRDQVKKRVISSVALELFECHLYL